MTRRFYLQTYGCQMNLYEAGLVRAIMTGAGWLETGQENNADLLLMMTCAVRGHAEARALGRLGSFRAVRAARPGTLIGVLGCMAQNLKDGLVSDAGADLVLGPDEYRHLPGLAAAALAEGRAQVAVSLTGECYGELQARPDSQVSAFVTVMRGCDNFCSYCIVPLVKGRERSRPLANIIAEARALVDQGIREVTLLGQNVLAYRHDGRGFCDVLAAVHEVRGLERIRFLTSHPRDLDERVLRTIAELPRVCPSLHLPLQSGSDRILRLMNRGYTSNDYVDKVALVRSVLPDAELTTDVMVGFPTETEADFADTLSLVERVRFAHAYMFRFSLRPGTRAVEFKPPVSAADAGRRLARLVEVQSRITLEHSRQMVGREFELLVEGPGPRAGGTLGRTRSNKVVILRGAMPAGAICHGLVTHVNGWTPVAEPVRAAAHQSAKEVA